MAEIRIRNTNERIKGEQAVREFLAQYEVIYEHWDTSKLREDLKKNSYLLMKKNKKF